MLSAPCPEKDPWLPSRMIARRIPRKRRQKVSMRRINPIEWTSGCLHSPAAEAVQDRVQLLTASRKRWEPPRILLARRLPAQSNIPKGTAMVTLRQFSNICL